MKANELRIGNLVLGKVNCVPIPDLPPMMYGTSTSVDLVENPVGWTELAYADKLQPIPLTEEWLIKFGFIKKQSSEDCSIFKHPIHFGQLVFARLKKNTEWSLQEIHGYDSEGELTNIVSINPIKYVHQLQNSYFALTGEELTANAS